jgi:hypothetical protein
MERLTTITMGESAVSRSLKSRPSIRGMRIVWK